MTSNVDAALHDQPDPTAVKPQPLRPHVGEEHFQAALDADATYRYLVLGAIALAFFAGSGFGILAFYADWVATALWCVTIAGFAARCAAPRAGMRPGAVDVNALRATLRLIAAAIAIAGVLACALAGARGLAALIAALGAAFLVLLTSLERKPRLLGLATVLVVAIGGPWALAMPADAGWTLLAVGGGVAAAAAVIVSARGRDGTINTALALTRLALLAWLVAAPGRIAMGMLPLVLAVAGLLVLDVLNIRRRSFAPTIAVVVLAHLAPALAFDATLNEPLLAQLPAAIGEFLLLMAAGYRHVIAAQLRLPQATYRVAPLCIVPRLDRAWDHPVKINVA